jgi:8-oxo-dGTP pyrophosphatase MutT (NUDIX family)
MYCSDPMVLPQTPEIRLSAVAPAVDLQGSFLRLERLRLKVIAKDGAESKPFEYDIVTRRALDSVVIAAHFERGGQVHIILLTAVRPPLWARDEGSMTLWELPAGLVEPGEVPRDAAARELFEETGARAEPAALEPLGAAMLPAPGMIAEVQSYFHVRVDPDHLAAPPGDSSALETVSTRAFVPLEEALALCASGGIRDMKTELALRRLRDALGHV